jgi:hypothetical protein
MGLGLRLFDFSSQGSPYELIVGVYFGRDFFLATGHLAGLSSKTL